MDNSTHPEKTGIHDATLTPLAVIDAKGGPVLRMLRADTPGFAGFNQIGEIYFSEVLPGEVKAWKMHVRQTQLFAVPMGQIKIVLYDQRAASPTLGVFSALILGRPDNYSLLRIPAGVWYGFQSVSSTAALICNCPDLPHDPAECRRKPANDKDFPYKW